MIYLTPKLSQADLSVLELIASQQDRLSLFTQNSPTRWLGSLRRSTLARAIQGSNSIEGFHASVDEVMAVVENERPTTDIAHETYAALMGYRNALTYIMQAAKDPHFEFSKQFLKSLQFMMLGHDLSKNPGQWRPGGIYVVNQATAQTVYEGPDADLVNDLAEELVAFLRAAHDGPVIVQAAMAHLNLTMIHPFKDGNGRMARALQTLVLAREGILHPIFSSIEEWLGRNTPDYYAVLADVGQGIWNPERDASPWIRFCLKAHYQQAATLIRRNEEYARLYERITALVNQESLPDRMVIPLFDAAVGWQITNARYRTDAEVGEFAASRDLRKLCEVGFLDPIGEKRGRVYRATKELATVRDSTRINRPLEDPYKVIEERGQFQLALRSPRVRPGRL
jgi:Fic family protein